ncbi:hypothetical protein [Azospirillum cavernae]|jgi:hypothetical protein|nr:hypothetical protein [Azospirillum cavernae]
MTPNTGSKRSHRAPRLLFAGLLFAGLLMLVARTASRPDVSLGEMLFPAIGGLVVLAAIAVIVRQDRRERDALPPAQRDRQDHGTPN